MSSITWQQVVAVAWPLLVALLLGFVVRKALLVIARRAGEKTDKPLRAHVAQVVAVPAAVALPLFFLSIAVGGTPLPEDWITRIQHWLGIGGLLCLTWLAARGVGALEHRILRDNPMDAVENLDARRVQTQTRVLGRIVQGGMVLVGVAIALMTFPAIREVGATLLASAGIIGLVVGIAGLQIAISQPIRLEDVVIVNGEWGRIEEISSTYVVVRIWDERRLIVPLQWFVENPFENWTRSTSQLLGTASLWLDYRTPVAQVREELKRICDSDERWDGRVCVVQVIDTDKAAIQVQLLVSARNSGDLFELRCAVRERMIEHLAHQHPEALPRLRADVLRDDGQPAMEGAREAGPLGASRAAVSSAVDTASPSAEDVNAADITAAAKRQRDR